jgi:acetyl-CoA/propionyl-CoA carboxylase carboxyl transferase subunit
VPRVTLVTRRAYGSPSIIFNSRALGASAVFAWPDAEIAPLVANGGLIRALDAGVVDEIVSPAETRSRIARALAAAPPARRSRANIPL